MADRVRQLERLESMMMESLERLHTDLTASGQPPPAAYVKLLAGAHQAILSSVLKLGSTQPAPETLEEMLLATTQMRDKLLEEMRKRDEGVAAVVSLPARRR